MSRWLETFMKDLLFVVILHKKVGGNQSNGLFSNLIKFIQPCMSSFSHCCESTWLQPIQFTYSQEWFDHQWPKKSNLKHKKRKSELHSTIIYLLGFLVLHLPACMQQLFWGKGVSTLFAYMCTHLQMTTETRG